MKTLTVEDLYPIVQNISEEEKYHGNVSELAELFQTTKDKIVLTLAQMQQAFPLKIYWFAEGWFIVEHVGEE